MRVYYGFLVSLLTIALSGCGLSHPVKLPQERTYTLSQVLPEASGQGYRSKAVLLVTLPVAAAGYNSARLVYEPLPFDLRYFANHRWVAPPAQMLLPLLAERIRHQHYFKSVVMAPFTGVADYHLDTQLVMLKQSFLKPVSVVDLVLQETLISDKTHRTIGSRRFIAQVKAPGNDPYSGIIAANMAVSQLNKAIANWAIKRVSSE